MSVDSKLFAKYFTFYLIKIGPVISEILLKYFFFSVTEALAFTKFSIFYREPDVWVCLRILRKFGIILLLNYEINISWLIF